MPDLTCDNPPRIVPRIIRGTACEVAAYATQEHCNRQTIKAQQTRLTEITEAVKEGQAT